MTLKILKNLILAVVAVLVCTTQTACSKQCKGIRSSGEKCERKAEPNSDFCYFHMTQDPTVRRCEKTTNKGTRCKLPAEPNSDFCEMHNVTPKEQCRATTRKGTRCLKAATKDGYCSQHTYRH